MRGLGHVRHPLRGASPSAANPDALHLAGPSPAQGTPRAGNRDGPLRAHRGEGADEEEALRFRPEDWGMERHAPDTDFMFLNVGPQHPGTHGPLRIVLELDGEEICDAVPDIGYPSPGRREDGRAADLAHLHPLHRPHRLPQRRHEQLRLRSGRGDASRGSTSPNGPR